MVLLAVITAVVSDSSRQTPPPIPVLDDPVQNHQFKSEYSDRLAKTAAFGGPKSPGTLQEVQKSSIPALPLQGYPAPEAVRPYPAQGYQFGSEYSGVYSRSAFAPKSAAGPSSYGKFCPVPDIAIYFYFYVRVSDTEMRAQHLHTVSSAFDTYLPSNRPSDVRHPAVLNLTQSYIIASSQHRAHRRSSYRPTDRFF